MQQSLEKLYRKSTEPEGGSVKKMNQTDRPLVWLNKINKIKNRREGITTNFTEIKRETQENSMNIDVKIFKKYWQTESSGI